MHEMLDHTHNGFPPLVRLLIRTWLLRERRPRCIANDIHPSKPSKACFFFLSFFFFSHTAQVDALLHHLLYPVFSLAPVIIWSTFFFPAGSATPHFHRLDFPEGPGGVGCGYRDGERPKA